MYLVSVDWLGWLFVVAVGVLALQVEPDRNIPEVLRGVQPLHEVLEHAFSCIDSNIDVSTISTSHHAVGEV